MKFFLAFLQSKQQHPIPAYGFWEFYIKNGLAEAGHQWTEAPDVDWALGMVPQSDASLAKWKTDAWAKTVDYLKKHPVEVFLCYLYPHQVDAAAITEIKKMGIPCVNFFCDNVREFRKAPAEFGVFSVNWVPESNALSQYKKAGYNYIHLPMPVWVAPHYRTMPAEKFDQVTFIGSKDIQRQLLLKEVVKKSPELPLKIYGSGWADTAQSLPVAGNYTLADKIKFQQKIIRDNGLMGYWRKLRERNIGATEMSAALKARVGNSPDTEEYINLTKNSAITLGVNRYPSYRYPLLQPDTYSRLRDIEAPMLGACYLTEWAQGIDELYHVGKEVITYRSADELAEKAGELLGDKAMRDNLRRNAQRKALNEHSIPESIKKLLQHLGLAKY